MRIALCMAACLLFAAQVCPARTWVFEENLETAGLTLDRVTEGFVEFTFRLDRVDIDDVDVDGRVMQQVSIPGICLPNDEGAPNLPDFGRMVAVPEGATARLEILSTRTRRVENVHVLPAPPIPREGDDTPPVFREDPRIYEVNALYPERVVRMSGVRNLRGVDAVMLGVTPFQYNPVSRDLTIYSEVRVRVSFEGGSGRFGEDRLRSRYWEPILRANLLNYDQLPEIDFGAPDTRDNEYEYVIIVPDDPTYIAWADSIRLWRTLQGIDAGIVTLTETGATYGAIESWINSAYTGWSTPPAAILLLADYVSNGGTTGITSPVYNSYCISDNIYGDVDGDDLPDIVMARMTATPTTIERLVTKAIDYERTPPTSPAFYQNPIVACGWQTERWFTICTEIVYGFLANVLGKTPVREYAIYDGTPGSVWSTNPNTYMLVNYFGPGGLGYIPATPAHLTDWGGNATRINSDINAGAFILQHRDHGNEYGWGEPDYDLYDFSGLSNDDLPFVFSINCLTGKFDMGGQCFTEAFHRMEHGALGLIGATETSYSFVNDAFIFGIYDCMWPGFDPGYPNEGPMADNGILRPAFANASGKYYLEASSWPYNPSDKEVTYHLFHAHTDAFQMLYSEVPQNLTVEHLGVMPIGVTTFTVTADEGSVIALTIDGEIIGLADGTGAPVDVTVVPAMQPCVMTVTVTGPNFYRYSADVQVISPNGPFLLLEQHTMSDSAGDADGIVDVGEPVSLVVYLENLGNEPSTNTVGVLTGPDLVFTDDTETWGTIATDETRPCDGAFDWMVAPGTPDQTEVEFTLNVTCDETTFVYEFSYVAEAPAVEIVSWYVDDSTGGDGDHRAEPGETVDLLFRMGNTGHEDARNVTGVLQCTNPMVTVDQNTASVTLIPESGEVELAGYRVTVNPACPEETTINLRLNVSGDFGFFVSLPTPLPVSPFFDEFEQPRGWTISGTAGSGAWAMADPEGTFYNTYPCQPEDDHSPAPGRRCMVTGPMAGSSAGQYDVDNGATVLTSPLFDLSEGIGAVLEYWRWYTNDLGESPGEDAWTVEVSDDDGATWVYLENTQASANEWRKFSFQLEDYIDLTPQVRIRFTAADEGGPSLVEAALDDVLLFLITEDLTDTAENPTGSLSRGEVALSQNRPNPFNPQTDIGFRLASARGRATVRVYDTTGRRVRTLVDEVLPAGEHHAVWDGTDEDGAPVASGVYFYRLTCDGKSETKRMVLLK